MKYVFSNEKMTLLGVKNEEMGYVLFPKKSDELVEIHSVYVSGDLRGQGIASQLMTHLCIHLRKNNTKAIPVCPYAVNWFNKNPDYQDVLGEK